MDAIDIVRRPARIHKRGVVSRARNVTWTGIT
jgi:hypothetical protein